jgi:hypothetical protein
MVDSRAASRLLRGSGEKLQSGEKLTAAERLQLNKSGTTF